MIQSVFKDETCIWNCLFIYRIANVEATIQDSKNYCTLCNMSEILYGFAVFSILKWDSDCTLYITKY